jgi:hypothetical protein
MENKLDIVQIIDNTPVKLFNDAYKNTIIQKLSENFDTNDQKLFLTSFYCFLNYDTKKDFVIDFDTVWKWCGFTRKDNAKTLLTKHFTIEIDYKVQNTFPASAGKVNYTVNKGQNTFTETSAKVNETANKVAPANAGKVEMGRPSETILLTINTFKKFCLKANTSKADEIHDYYIKLEGILHEITIEHNKRLELENQINLDTISKLNNKLNRKQRAKYELTNCVYIISNDLFKGYYKIGKSSSFNNRLNTYATGAPIDYKVDYLHKVRSKSEETTIENMVLQILSSYRVKNHMDQDREWIKGIDLATIKNVMNNCIKFINDNRQQYDIKKEEKNGFEEKEKEEKEKEEEEKEEEKEEEIIVNEENDDDYVENDVENDVEDSSLKRNNSKYNLNNIEIKSKNNPIDFDKFVSDYCETGNDSFYVIQSDLKLAYKIWGRTTLDLIVKQFMAYMNEHYKDTRIIIDNQKRHVFKGIKLKPLKYKSQFNFDFEEFIEKECVVDYLHKISYNDFFHYFIEWKKSSEPTFKLNKHDTKNIKEILENCFCRGRVINSTQSKTKNLYGMLGVGIKHNNYGIVDTKRQNKIVKEIDVITNEIIKEYDSIIACANELNIVNSTFSNYIRNKTVINGKYYTID